jgi:hypothetical protein
LPIVSVIFEHIADLSTFCLEFNIRKKTANN